MPKESRRSRLFTLEEAAFAHWNGRARPHGSGPNLYLAEDEPILRSLMHINLALAGYRVTLFADGVDLRHALAHTASTMYAPDLVVAEMRLPGMLGTEVLEASRLGPAWRIPFILLSGAGDRILHEQAFRLGAQVVLEKPFEIRALLDEASHLVAPIEEAVSDARS